MDAMTSIVQTVTFDCARPAELARFWNQVTGWPIHEESDDEEALLTTPAPLPAVLFVRVPEGKAAKNRMHFDLRPDDVTRDEEVRRLVGLGATIQTDLRNADGTGWAVMADPEGNEFCVERSEAERRTAAPHPA